MPMLRAIAAALFAVTMAAASPALADGSEEFHKGFTAAARSDHAEAARWFRLAAEQGRADAQHLLGVLYADGQGVPQDDVAAYMWFNLAAAQGIDEAAKNRDIMAGRLTAAAREAAQRLSRECLARGYKNC